MRRLVCACVVGEPPKTGFLASWPKSHYTMLCIENVWAFKFPFWVNERPHIEHTKGREPVCIRSCILRCEDFESLNHTYSWHDRVRSHYTMHRKCMSFQVPLLSKRAPTNWTHERPWSCVYTFMHLEMWRFWKSESHLFLAWQGEITLYYA